MCNTVLHLLVSDLFINLSEFFNLWLCVGLCTQPGNVLWFCMTPTCLLELRLWLAGSFIKLSSGIKKPGTFCIDRDFVGYKLSFVTSTNNLGLNSQIWGKERPSCGVNVCGSRKNFHRRSRLLTWKKLQPQWLLWVSLPIIATIFFISCIWLGKGSKKKTCFLSTFCG